MFFWVIVWKPIPNGQTDERTDGQPLIPSPPTSLKRGTTMHEWKYQFIRMEYCKKMWNVNAYIILVMDNINKLGLGNIWKISQESMIILWWLVKLSSLLVMPTSLDECFISQDPARVPVLDQENKTIIEIFLYRFIRFTSINNIKFLNKNQKVFYRD